jgi:hypothetical protein
MCLPPLTAEIAPPSWATGAAYPLGDIGQNFYVGFENGIAGWDDASDDWFAVQNTWPASFEIFNEAVSFCGALVVPGGDSASAAILQESNPATGALTVTSAGVELSAVALHDGKLWGYNEATGAIGSITVTGALDDPTDPANWDIEQDAFGNLVLLDPELTIRDLINFYNSAQEETLWAISRGQGAYLWDPGQPKWIKSTVKDGAHPDWGIASDVFRDGEDLFIAGGGLDLTRFTTSNVEVPLSGPSKDQGVPPKYQGNIVDLCSERSTLYALVRAATAPEPINQDIWVGSVSIAGGPGATTSPLQFNDPEQMAVDSAGNLYVADSGNDRLLKLDEDGAFLASITGLTDVTGVAIDASDNIYVAYENEALNEVRKYNASLVAQWTIQTDLSPLRHLATDGTNVYVAASSGVLVLLCADGSEVEVWGDTVLAWALQGTVGTTGSGTGPQFDTPDQVAVSDAGDIYVADTTNRRLLRLGSDGSFVTQQLFGFEDDDDRMKDISGVAVGDDGKVFASYIDLAGNDVQVTRFTANLAYEDVTPTIIAGSSGSPRHLTHDGTNLYLTLGTSRIYRIAMDDLDVDLWLNSSGSGNGQLDTPIGILYHNAEIYVVDSGNSRVQVFNTSAVYQRQWAISANCRGITVDAEGNILVADADGTVWRFTDAGVAVDSFSQEGAQGLAAYGEVIYVTNATSDNLARWEIDATIAAGTDNGEFDTPYGIAYSAADDVIFVVDSGNDRVQRLTPDGTYEAQWAIGTNGRGAACDDLGNVWVAEYDDNQVRRFSAGGAAQETFAQSTPIGVAFSDPDLWVSSGQHNSTRWGEETVTLGSEDSVNWLAAWTGTAWCGLWESPVLGSPPTWMKVAFNGQYSLWWGDDDGVCYRQLLPPPFFNPATRMEYRVYPFAETGWMETIRYDASMSGWDKIASHAFAMMDYASALNYVDVSYRTDADQFTSGLLDPPYRAWKRVDHIGRTLMWFDDDEDDPISGLPWHEGEPFQWIQFKFEFVRDPDDTYVTPVWMWHSLHHLSVPQDSASFVIKIPLSAERSINGRSPNEMAQTLRSLQTTRALVHLQTGNPRPGNPDWQVFFRGRVTQVKSEFHPGANNNLDEILVVNFVEVGASSNEHTIVAP